MNRSLRHGGLAVVLLAATLLAAGAVGFAAPAAHAAAIVPGDFVWPSAFTPGILGATSVQALVPAPSGAVYAVGRYESTSSAPADSNILCARVDPATGGLAGGVIWVGRTFSAATSDKAGNLIVAGVSAPGKGNISLMKMSPASAKLWTREWDGTAHGSDAATSVVTDASGNIYVAGRTFSTVTGCDGVILKYNRNGVFQWRYVVATKNRDELNTIAIDTAGNVYAVGQRNATAAAAQIITLKITPAGRVSWIRLSGVGKVYRGLRLVVRSSGAAVGVYVAGTVRLTNPTDPVNPFRAVIARYTLNGYQKWIKQQPEALTGLSDMTVDGAARTIIVGGQRNAYHNCGLLAAYTPTGATRLVYQFSNTQMDDPNDPGVGFAAGFSRVLTDGAGDIYVSGWMATNATVASTNAIVGVIPSLSGDWSTFALLWRYDGPASGTADTFGPLLLLPSDDVVVGGLRNGAIALQGVVQRLAWPTPAPTATTTP
jgi:hypothetical protein